MRTNPSTPRPRPGGRAITSACFAERKEPSGRRRTVPPDARPAVTTQPPAQPRGKSTQPDAASYKWRAHDSTLQPVQSAAPDGLKRLHFQRFVWGLCGLRHIACEVDVCARKEGSGGELRKKT